MKYIALLLLLLVAHSPFLLAQNCNSSQAEVIITIVPDNYPQETSWLLQNQLGDTLATGLANSDTLCVPSNTCLVFTIFDSYGDGLCCAYGNGGYQLRVNGSLQASGGQFGFIETKFLNCGPGQACSSPLTIGTGSHSAPQANSWYSFQPDSMGIYLLSTCTAPVGANTRLWVYDNCNVPVLAPDNMGTVFFNDTNVTCGSRARLEAYLDTAVQYLIRVGGDSLSGPIPFSITYLGPLSGCGDSLACNFDPLATVTGPCVYFPSPLCPPGPDLEIVQSVFENSLQRSTVTSSNCMVAEQCLTGYGTRTVIRFTTDIRNVGQTDYFIGNPQTHPGQFNTNNCHNHAHYEGYAEYVLYPRPTTGARIPIGFKNGFCVMDLDCPPGMAKYGCSFMGITAGCGDIYGRGLDCQWIDITDVTDGAYILATKVNWSQSPDALGRYELTYANNWAQVCINIYTDSLGEKQFTTDTACGPYIDCAGTPYGTALLDCEGVCGGSAIMGDLNADTVLTSADYTAYIAGLMQQNLPYSACRDMNGDSTLNIWDAVLLGNCMLQQTGNACTFPYGLHNQNQRVDIRIDHVDTVQQYIDIAMRNPSNELTAFELDLHGVWPTAVLNMLPASEPAVQFYQHQNGKIIGVVQDLSNSVNRSSPYRSAFRVFYSRTTDTLLYIKEAVAAVNEIMERVDFVAGTAQFQIPATNTTSVQSLNNRPTFNLFPNPTDGGVQLQGLPDNQPVQVRLFDALGRLVWEQSALPFDNGQQRLELGGLPAGLYHVVVRASYGISSTRLVKR